MAHVRQIALAACCVAFLQGPPAQAQRPVYRCETAGRASYSDEPCVGAKLVDATPTQGVDKMTGVTRKGADVQRYELDGLKAEALKPLTGMNPDQYRVYKRCFQLSPKDKFDCARLDADLPALTDKAAKARPAERAAAEVDLYKARKHFHDLNC